MSFIQRYWVPILGAAIGLALVGYGLGSGESSWTATGAALLAIRLLQVIFWRLQVRWHRGDARRAELRAELARRSAERGKS